MITEIPDTVAKFAEICKQLSSDDIYELFEYRISDSVRNEIFALSAEKTSPEPVRLRLNMLGEKYDVQALKDY
jgi:hypothetical protein